MIFYLIIFLFYLISEDIALWLKAGVLRSIILILGWEPEYYTHHNRNYRTMKETSKQKNYSLLISVQLWSPKNIPRGRHIQL